MDINLILGYAECNNIRLYHCLCNYKEEFKVINITKDDIDYFKNYDNVNESVYKDFLYLIDYISKNYKRVIK